MANMMGGVGLLFRHEAYGALEGGEAIVVVGKGLHVPTTLVVCEDRLRDLCGNHQTSDQGVGQALGDLSLPLPRQRRHVLALTQHLHLLLLLHEHVDVVHACLQHILLVAVAEPVLCLGGERVLRHPQIHNGGAQFADIFAVRRLYAYGTTTPPSRQHQPRAEHKPHLM